jgi:uncharacterized OB-fold protein
MATVRPWSDVMEVCDMGSEPLAEDLFTWPSKEPQLIGNRCQQCGAVTFPVRAGCARCGSTDLKRHLLARHGTLWTWTSQGFLPKAPFAGNLAFGADSVPWFVGLVELPGELRVESLLVGATQENLKIGMPMRLVVVPFRLDMAGHAVVTFAFTPDLPDEQQSTTETEIAHA